MVSNNRQMNRNERQRQLNMALCVFPKFSPLFDCQIYLINQTTPSLLIQDLIQLAKQTTQFTIDTECDYITHKPALIQIEFLNTNSVVLLIETCHLPHHSSVLFWLIRSLLKIILQSSNVILSWGDIIFELCAFIHYGLFSFNTIHQINAIDVQRCFKKWYNQTFVHMCTLQPYHEDSPLCTCLYRPVKDATNQWSLQRAIAYTFHEFLDKSRTKSNWSQRLSFISNIYQYNIIHYKMKQARLHLITYAVNDCLAVTKLMMVVKLNWTKEQLQHFNQFLQGRH